MNASKVQVALSEPVSWCELGKGDEDLLSSSEL